MDRKWARQGSSGGMVISGRRLGQNRKSTRVCARCHCPPLHAVCRTLSVHAVCHTPARSVCTPSHAVARPRPARRPRAPLAAPTSMIDKVPSSAPQPLNSYNVAQLQFALQDPKSAVVSLPFDVRAVDDLSLSASPAIVHPSEHDIDYSSRRMSSSATSDSSFQSRPEKRGISPSDSPLPKKSRPAAALDASPWSHPNTPSPHPSTNPDHDDKSDLDSLSKVQLPSLASTFQDRHELRRASLPALHHSEGINRLRLPLPAHRPSQSSSGLASYQFPPPDSLDSKFGDRPRLATDTQLGLYNGSPGADYSNLSSAAVSSNSPSSFGFSPLTPGEYGNQRNGISPSFSSDSDHWASGIVRPSSTPGHIVGATKYDDNLRHSSLGGPVSQQQMFGGVPRLSGHQNISDRRSSVKTEGDQWTFPSGDFNMNPPSSAPSYPSTPSTSASSIPPSAPSINVTSSPNRSPQASTPAPSSLVERPPRKRGKLPKPVTDFLKDWLHRHSDHPYPSEEEKKQLCHATGLSMSQVSNWMINARRRILAPAHRAAAGPTTTTPFNSRSGPSSVLDTGRRASMPTDSLQLYYPMSLQSLEHGMPSSTRHMVGMTRSLSSSHAGGLGSHHSPYGLDASYAQGRLAYGGGGGGALHPSGLGGSGGQGGYLGVPMSAPPALTNPSSFLGSNPHQQQSVYGQSPGYMAGGGSNGRMLTPQDEPQPRYSFPDHSASPQPGSGYATPQ
ncbi:hypothetical protein OBBRIDRAFT_792628 [Obba rivulosa]|uniref:Homeobox domain-containing protein n=1 Tax=Obba rivulosa TaxID=1052685 RepID=A0A8E2B2P4_9APHY|nr:hypothetical protein OBBRIDRAFT_792628 [Obba rivulosa]